MVTVTHLVDGLSSSRVTVTRPDGSFSLTVEPGDYRVSLSGSASVHLKVCGASGN